VHRHDVEVRVGRLHDRVLLTLLGRDPLDLRVCRFDRHPGLEPPDRPQEDVEA
jgi:hypothetical protein